MRLVGAITAMVLLVSVNVSPSIGQDGIFPPSLFPNSPIVSNTESQLNDTQVELDRVSTGFSKLPEQQQPQQPQQPQQSSQQPQQPIQQTFGNQQENRPQYPQAQQPAQIPQYPQQSPTQYPKPQSSQFPQQPQSAQSETRYPEQQTQYSQPSVPSLSLPLSEQISHVDSHNQSSSNAVGTKNNTLTTGTKILDADSQGESKNATTTTTASTTISAATTTTPPEPEKTGMDQKNGEAESLVDYALGLAGYKGDSEDEKDKDKTVSAPATDTASPTPTTSTVSNCNLPASLQSCGMPADVLGYFNYNVSVRGVLASIFRPDIVQMLSQQCEPGSWCLSYDIHLDIMDGMDRFYLDGPLCSAAMWSCMERTWTTRNACENKELSFLMASVKTLCDLSEFGLTDKRCYTRTLEALYATYVNTFPPIDKKPGKHDGNFCESYTAKMTKTYLCADDSCSYDQMIVLERFQPWVELVENATSVYTNCNMTELCQYEDEEDYLEELEEEIEDEYEDYSYDYYDSDYNEEDEEEEEQEEGRGDGETDEDSEDEGMGDFLQDDMDLSPTGSNSGEQFGDGLDKPNVDKIATEENIVLGLVVIIAMAGVVVLCLVVVIYNRFHSSQMGSHRGYSKLMEEEGRMMHNEYS